MSVLAQKLDIAVGGGRSAAESAKVRPLSPAIKLAARRMNWLPMSAERAYGQHLLEELRKAGRLMAPDSRAGAQLYPKAEALLSDVLAGVQQPHAYKFEVHVSSEAGENAMALPGGIVLIDKALIEKNELRDKALFAVSHEVGHVLQRHQTHALQARVIDVVALKGSLPELVKSLKSVASKPEAIVGLLAGAKLVFERHSISQELQADACAMRVLDDGKTSDSRLLAAVQGFARSLPPPDKRATSGTGAAGGATMQSLETLIDFVQRPVDAHPSTPERLANLDMMMGELRQRPSLVAASAKREATAAVKPVKSGKPAGGSGNPASGNAMTARTPKPKVN